MHDTPGRNSPTTLKAELTMGLHDSTDRDEPEVAAAEPIEMIQERREFLSRLSLFGLGEATERLLSAGGVIPAGRRKPFPPTPLPNG